MNSMKKILAVVVPALVVINLIYISLISGETYEGKFRLIWKKVTDWNYVRTPAVAKGYLYVMTEHGKLSVLDIRNGKKIRDIIPPERGDLESPVIEDGVLYLACGNSNMTAFNLSDASVIWSTYVVPKSYISGSIHPEWIFTMPSIGKDLIYFGSQDGKVYALDRKSGKPVWEYSIGRTIASPPFLTENILYVASFNSQLCAIEASSGKLIWSCSLGEEVEYGSPIANGTTVFIAGRKGTVFAIDTVTHKIQWKRQVGSCFRRGLSLSDKLLCVADKSGIYGLDSLTGKILWIVKKGGNNPRIVDNMVYCVSMDGDFLIIDGRNGQIVDKYTVNGPNFWCSPVVWGKRILIAAGETMYCFELRN